MIDINTLPRGMRELMIARYFDTEPPSEAQFAQAAAEVARQIGVDDPADAEKYAGRLVLKRAYEIAETHRKEVRTMDTGNITFAQQQRLKKISMIAAGHKADLAEFSTDDLVLWYVTRFSLSEAEAREIVNKTHEFRK